MEFLRASHDESAGSIYQVSSALERKVQVGSDVRGSASDLRDMYGA